MAVAFDAISIVEEDSGDGVVSLTHTPVGSSNLGVFAGVGNVDGAAGTASTSVTFAGTSMTEKWDFIANTSRASAGYAWPGGATVPGGGSTVTSTLAAATLEHVLVVVSMTGVDQTTPVGTPATASGTTSPANAALGSINTGDLCVDFVMAEASPTAGGSQTERVNHGGNTFAFYAVSTMPGSSGGSPTWTFANSNWEHGVIAFKASGAAPSGDFGGPSSPLYRVRLRSY